VAQKYDCMSVLDSLHIVLLTMLTRRPIFSPALFQGSQDSNYSQPSSDLSPDEEGDALRRETAKQALAQLDKARVGTKL